jgi:NADPH:quinone reductase-like Zn-dependent oxidoreductase
MRAALHRTHGGPEVLVVEEVADPEIGPADVLLRVRAAALNRLDVVHRNGWFTLPGFALPHIPGMDVAGEIVAVGAEVRSVAVGDRVVVDPSMVEVAGDSRFTGMGDLYGVLGIIGGTLPGGYAELCAAPASHVFRIPDDVSFEDAACLPTVFTTAWHGLFPVGHLTMGETLLVHGANSGVSSAAIILAKRAGATVVATAGTDAKLDWAKRLGADHVCNNRTDDVAAFAREVTGGVGVDVVLDHVGPALWDASVHSLRVRGRLVLCGNGTGNEVTLNLAHTYHMGLQVLGSDPYRPDEVPRILAAAWSEPMPSLVDRVFPLDDAAHAHEIMEAGDFCGKLVLVP